MKVGDLVIRDIGFENNKTGIGMREAAKQRQRLGYGVILTKQMAGNPSHPCITVFYPQTGKIYDIAESLMEVINESR